MMKFGKTEQEFFYKINSGGGKSSLLKIAGGRTLINFIIEA